MYELQAQSSSRGNVPVLWITIHTAEGPTDEFPSRPDLDAGSADDLLRFFEGKTDRSCHAICDDDKIIDDLVSYDRAAWTLRNGNPRSDNLEMCGLASWSRAEWLTHDGMLRNCARWVTKRLKARYIEPKRLSIADVRTWSKRGYMDHNTYTQATGDGTHWDVGPDFPWDVFGNYVTSFYTESEDDVTPDEVKSAVREVFNLPDTGMALPYGQSHTGNVFRTLVSLAQTGYNKDREQDASDSSVGARLDRIESDLAEIKNALTGGGVTA